MPRFPTDLTTCFLGVSFFRTLDSENVWTSIAQVFNERGVGVIVRGAMATVSKDDRQPHLSAEDARELISAAMQRYRQEHGNLPARLVVHKTSGFTDAEVEGCRAAIDELSIQSSDILSLRISSTRLLRHGRYPPLRGTMLTLDERTHVLYARQRSLLRHVPRFVRAAPAELPDIRGGSEPAGTGRRDHRPHEDELEQH